VLPLFSLSCVPLSLVTEALGLERRWKYDCSPRSEFIEMSSTLGVGGFGGERADPASESLSSDSRSSTSGTRASICGVSVGERYDDASAG
jgi:hypothetical protein